MSEVWFTSDTHFGHEFVARLRHFDSVDEHDEYIFAAWNEVVEKRDQVWVLGDLTLNDPEKLCYILAGLPGEKHLILGNHDRGHPSHRDSHKQLWKYAPAFKSVQQAARRNVGQQHVLLSHFPYDGDHAHTNRHMQWRLRDEGDYLLHGHTHGPGRFNGREIHVGLDAWAMGFVPLGTIASYIERTSG